MKAGTDCSEGICFLFSLDAVISRLVSDLSKDVMMEDSAIVFKSFGLLESLSCCSF